MFCDPYLIFCNVSIKVLPSLYHTHYLMFENGIAILMKFDEICDFLCISYRNLNTSNKS